MSMPYTAAMMAASNGSLADLERAYNHGLLPYREYRRALVFSTWCASRFGGEAGRRQDVFWNTRGRDAFNRRMDAVLRLYRAAQKRGLAQWELYRARCTLPAGLVKDWSHYPKAA